MKPRYYQSEAVISFFDFFANGGIGNPLIAMPTGTGKSLVMALLIMEICRRYRGQRILMATHVKELIDNNYKTLLKVWPSAPAGIYSAGLDRKDVGFPITYAGIGSIHKKAHIFQKIDIMLIDEAHLISPKTSTMYRKFIDDLKRYNPYLVIVGLTATPFRMGQGMLTNEYHGHAPLFTHFCYDITGVEAFNRLLNEGFLCTLIPQKTNTELDVEGLHIVNGEFNIAEMQERYNIDKVIIEALEEAIVRGHDRKHWLIFATGVEHCDRISKLLNEKYGISCVSIHSKEPDRDKNFKLFTTGQVRAAVNNNCLTTGVDYPDIDLAIILRPTNSPGLWVQILGRFIRPVWPNQNKSNWHLWPQGYVESGRYDIETQEGRLLCIKEGPKQNALVLDFAANTKRLGPINDPIIPYPRKKKGGEPRSAPIKICDNCGMYNHASVRICGHCGYEFPRVIKIMSEASHEELIKTQEIIIKVLKVTNVSYDTHSKAGKADSMVVIYQVGLLDYKFWVCLEHPEPSGHKARQWWRKASRLPDVEIPTTTAEAILRTDELYFPSHIRVRLDTQFPQVMDVDYTGTAFGSEEITNNEDEQDPF